MVVEVITHCLETRADMVDSEIEEILHMEETWEDPQEDMETWEKAQVSEVNKVLEEDLEVAMEPVKVLEEHLMKEVRLEVDI